VVANLKNKWLTNAKNNQIIEEIDEHLMNAWASDVTIGEFLNSLPDNLKKVFLNLTINVPVKNDDSFEIGLNFPK
jgi:hypothetical protein